MRTHLGLVVAALLMASPAFAQSTDDASGDQTVADETPPADSGDASDDGGSSPVVEGSAGEADKADKADKAEETSDKAGDDAGDETKSEEADAKPEPLSETFLVNQALTRADVIAEHQAKMEKAEWQQYRADWAWFPKVRSETGVTIVPAEADPNNLNNNFDEFASLDVGPVWSQSISVLVPIYTFDRISIAQDLAAVGIDAESLKLEAAKRDVEFQVRRAYYAVQLSNSLSELLSEGGGLIKEQLVEMEDARDFGDADFEIEDLRKLQIFDAEVDSRRLDNQKLATIARAGVRYFAKVDGGFAVEAMKEEGEVEPLGTLAEYQSAARSSRPEVLLLEHAVEARRLQLELQKSEFYPNIFVAGTFKYVGSTETIALKSVCRRTEVGGECVDTSDLIAPPYSNPLDVLSFGVALGMRWDFDYPQAYGKYKEVEAQNNEVTAQRDRALGAIALEVEKIWTDASHARQKVEITDRRLDAARRWRDQFGLGMQQGGANIEDAVDPLKAYFEAKALNLQARFEYQVARAELAKAVGVPNLGMVATSKSKSK